MHIFIGILVGIIVLSMILNYILIEGQHLSPVPSDRDFEQPHPRMNTVAKKILESFYFTASTWSTTGCPDILPVTSTGKLFVSVQNVFILALAVGALKISMDLTHSAQRP